jgi:hypothetical protein
MLPPESNRVNPVLCKVNKYSWLNVIVRVGAGRFVAFQCRVQLRSQLHHSLWVPFGRHFCCDVMPVRSGFMKLDMNALLRLA